MATLKAKKLRDALQKARNVGRAEESVEIDGCTIVLQSLPSDDYDAVLREVSDLEGSEYLHAFQEGYVCRSIVEIQGNDLREVDFVEEDVPAGSYLINAVVSTESKANKAKEALKTLGVDLVVVPPDGSEGTRLLMLEKHEWIRNLLKSWSQEALAVAWRKYADVVVTGEQKAREKVEFRTPDESSEDKFRRLINEAKTLENELPPELLTNILGDVGYLQRTSVVELEEAVDRIGKLTPEPEETIVQEAPMQASVQEELPFTKAPTPEELMGNRKPLNQEVEPVRAPAQLKKAQATPQIDPSDDFDPMALPNVAGVYPTMDNPGEIAELHYKKPGIDGAELHKIIDTPPVVGINPRFQPRHGR